MPQWGSEKEKRHGYNELWQKCSLYNKNKIFMENVYTSISTLQLMELKWKSSQFSNSSMNFTKQFYTVLIV